jgi:hypothetical protein
MVLSTTVLTTPPPNSRIPDYRIGDVISMCQNALVNTGNQWAYNCAATAAMGCRDVGALLVGAARCVEAKSLRNHCV